ncbi:Hypothetical protein FKW44_012293 [Caligus rogercresseyi]|uniref:Uncharacterized protein n=1 Tax=Caligus rogercresseyi TaxID=217165 RepID=A0A7T8HJH2_CALRO|nr:Hypothetical protein FKW44_012293 [Caligus rogercresseyi]
MILWMSVNPCLTVLLAKIASAFPARTVLMHLIHSSQMNSEGRIHCPPHSFFGRQVGLNMLKE